MYEIVYMKWIPKKFRMLRLNVECFDELLDIVRVDIEKMDTQFRLAIRPDINV